jgi:hypothetical protein
VNIDLYRTPYPYAIQAIYLESVLPSTPRTLYKLLHPLRTATDLLLTYTSRYKTPPGICEHLYKPARGIQSWHLTAPYFYEQLRIRYSLYISSQRDPLASANTLTNPPGEPELAPNYYTITSPSSICEYPYKPARGT